MEEWSCFESKSPMLGLELQEVPSKPFTTKTTGLTVKESTINS